MTTLSAHTPKDSAVKFLAEPNGGAAKDTLLFVHQNFYRWCGTHYQQVQDGAVRQEVYLFLSRAQSFLSDGNERVPFKVNPKRVDEVVDCLRMATHRTVDAPGWLSGGERPPATEMLPCRNGLLHLPTRTLFPHTPDFFCLTALDYDYDVAARPAETWVRFLDQLFQGDDVSKHALQEMIGYFLSSDTSQQKIFFLLGPARSGKGTIVGLITRLLGVVNVVSTSPISLGQQFGLQPLINKSLAVLPDARFGGRTDLTAVVVRLLSISGEDRQTIDRKFLSAWEGKLNVRFLIVSNELPALPDASAALSSRMVVLRLTESFIGKENTRLLGELLSERAGILNWALDGAQRLRERGHFVEPEASIEMRAEMADAGSPIAAFVSELCDIGPQCSVESKALYLRWEEWCKLNGERPGGNSAFGLLLRTRLPSLKTKQRRAGSLGKPRYYIGVGLSQAVTRDLVLHPVSNDNEGSEIVASRDGCDSVTEAATNRAMLVAAH